MKSLTSVYPKSQIYLSSVFSLIIRTAPERSLSHHKTTFAKPIAVWIWRQGFRGISGDSFTFVRPLATPHTPRRISVRSIRSASNEYLIHQPINYWSLKLIECYLTAPQALFVDIWLLSLGWERAIYNMPSGVEWLLEAAQEFAELKIANWLRKRD